MAITGPDDATTAESLAELYRGHSRWLKAAVRLRGGADLTEDVVQESFLRISRYGSQVPLRHPKALLLKIAENLLRSAARRSSAAARYEKDSIHCLHGQDTLLPDQLQAIVLKEAILALPEIYRDVFMLSRFGGMSYQEIAEARGLSVKTVEWRMSKALAMCAARMRE